jgi:hypothetical protein
VQFHRLIQINTAAPQIASSSHPSQTAWSASTDVFYSWTFLVPDASVAGEHYVLDHFAETIPTASDTFVPVTQKTLLRAGLASGIWFLHVVSEDTRGYLTRQADHYQARIGT